MKRYVLVVAALTTTLVTGMTLHAAGWLTPRAVHARTAHTNNHPVIEHSVSSIPAYYRQGGPRHWRDCLGQY